MLPNIGVYHPQIIHFVIALLITGVVFRLVSLTGKFRFTGPSALVLLLAGTVAAVLAVESGSQAHGRVEQIPGIREHVEEHQEWGERTRTLFLGIAVLELAALAIRKQKWHQGLLIASAVAGVIGIGFIYETGEHGGHIVYGYAGGPGIRSGDPQDVDHLLIAGLYEKAMQDRRGNDPEGAADLFDELARRYGANRPDIQLLAIESKLVDLHDPQATLAALRTFAVPEQDRGTHLRVGLLQADAFVAAQQPDAARAVLQALSQAFPDNPRIRQRLDSLR